GAVAAGRVVEFRRLALAARGPGRGAVGPVAVAGRAAVSGSA
ncbi:MAG: hypothetical protein JWM15_2302, partial [Cryptosporangiaceae bacterium]|nr:hypothetical protein [Cryptosporangiaceae bacterium]